MRYSQLAWAIILTEKDFLTSAILTVFLLICPLENRSESVTDTLSIKQKLEQSKGDDVLKKQTAENKKNSSQGDFLKNRGYINLKGPKITLKLNEMMICRGIYKRNPIKPGIKFINNVDSLFCYTKISNSGNKQEVKHIWYFENKEMTTVSYNIKTSYNYRSWSKKTIYPNQTGKWRVDVVSKSGDILGSRDFTVNSINATY